MLLYLSRTREYYADEFSGEETGSPSALSMALIKIAYGLTKLEPSPFNQKFLGGTRALGISDVRSASGAGYAYQAANRQPGPAFGAMAPAYAGAAAESVATEMQAAVTLEGVRRIEKVFLFDVFNPWGTLSELGSTHPLTGKRIRALGEQSSRMGKRPLFTFERIDAAGRAIDAGRLYGGFFFEATIYFLPLILGAMFALLAAGLLAMGRPDLGAASAGGILFGAGLGMTIKGLYSFPPLGDPAVLGVIDLMSDPYASPLKGRPVVLEGTVIGRANAGNRLSEDVVIEDSAGGLMMINYESPLGALGNLWFATQRVQRLMGQPVRVLGWFRRGMSQQVDLKSLRAASGEGVSSWTAFWGRASGVVVLILGFVVAVAGALTVASTAGGAALF